jgi:2-polyprenyl-6-methoxyphenol hydroxylase-like FAD-dependent oxidoreductase
MEVKMRLDNVIIIGGGIGGLTLAGALGQNAIAATVYEQAPRLREIGSGVALWSGAISALEQVGYREQVAELGAAIPCVEFISQSGQLLKSYSVEELLDRASIASTPRVVHRGGLIEMLATRVAPEQVVTGKRCVQVDWQTKRPTVHFDDGTSAQADLVVGADGLWSQVRASLWGDEPPRYSGEFCFRGTALIEGSSPKGLCELQGSGRRFGLTALGEHLTYWWATAATDEDFELDPCDYHAFLAAHFADWPLDIPEIIAATRADDFHLDGLYDRAPRSTWSRGAVTLLGDAAHPTTPNLGQGACMAIEDAAVLAELLAKSATLDQALSDYERIRVPRTTKLVNESYRFGQVGQWTHPLAVWLREAAVRLAPRKLMGAQLVDKVAYDALGETHKV